MDRKAGDTGPLGIAGVLSSSKAAIDKQARTIFDPFAYLVTGSEIGSWMTVVGIA